MKVHYVEIVAWDVDAVLCRRPAAALRLTLRAQPRAAKLATTEFDFTYRRNDIAAIPL